MGPVVALSGFMGSGKTTVGSLAAARLGFAFLDLDEEVEQSAGMRIEEIFSREGEEAFRTREAAVLHELLRRHREVGNRSGLIVSLGGGAVTVPAVAELLKREAIVIFLKSDVEDAWKRVQGSTRPLAASSSGFRNLFARRAHAYAATADATIETGSRSVEQVVSSVVETIRGAAEARA